jgi:hypothetical protein
VPKPGRAGVGDEKATEVPATEVPASDPAPAAPDAHERTGKVRVKQSARYVKGKTKDVAGKATAAVALGWRWYASRPWLPARLFAAVTQLPALLVVAWLLPAAALLITGRLLPGPVVIIFVPLAVALCFFSMRQLPESWPRFAPGAGTGSDGPTLESQPSPETRPFPAYERVPVPGWPLALTGAIAAGFTVWQAIERSTQLIVARGSGVYLQYAYWIAHHGAVKVPVSAADFGGLAPGLSFASPGFLASGSSSLVPGAMPGLPLVLTAALWVTGISGALLTGPVLGGLAIVSFAGLAGRLAGARWAPGAALVLAVALPQQFVSRTTLGEPLIQILLFGGLCLAADSLALPLPASGAHAAPGPWRRRIPWQAMTLAGLGGLAIGLTTLVNVGALAIVLPLFPVLAVMFVARMPQAGTFAVGLLAGIGYGVAAGSRLARPYLSTLRVPLHDVGLAAAGFGIATALIAPLAFPATRALARRAVSWRIPVMGLSGVTHRVPVLSALLQGLAVLAPVALLTWFAVRPTVAVARGATDPFVMRFVASLQRLERLPVDGHRQYYEQSLNWVIWYLGLPCLLLACIGFALLGRRCLSALLSWRGPAPAARMWGMPLLVIGWSVAAVLWVPATLPDQPWASRRLVPVVLPGLICLAVWVCSRVRLRADELGAGQVAGSVVSVCCVLALALPAAVTTFDPGYASNSPRGAASGAVPGAPSGASPGTRRFAARGMAFRPTYRGELSAVAGLCAAIGPSASVIIVDRTTAASFTQVVRGMCGTPTARMDSAPAGAVNQVINAIERVGRRPVLLGATSRAVSLVGAVPQQALHLSTKGDAHALTGPPAAPWSVTYTVWLASPAGAGSTA